MPVEQYKTERLDQLNRLMNFLGSRKPSFNEKQEAVNDYRRSYFGFSPEYRAKWLPRFSLKSPHEISGSTSNGFGKIKKSPRRKKKGAALDVLSKLSKMKTKKRPGTKKVSKKLEDLLLDRPIKIEPQSPPLPTQPKINEEPGIPPVEYFLSMLDKLEREGKVPKNPLL